MLKKRFDPTIAAEGTPVRRKQVVDLHKTITQKFRKGSPWTKDDVIKAAKGYMATGTWAQAARITGIPVESIKSWGKKDYWPILLEELNYLKNIETDRQLSQLMEKALEESMDRLVNGDHVVVKGEIHRKPVTARDAALIAAIAYDKRALHRGDPTKIEEKNFSVDERLIELKETFDALARRNEEKVVAEIPKKQAENQHFLGRIEDYSDVELAEIALDAEQEAEEIREAIKFEIDGTDG
jgi:hypothetical protein